MQIIRWRATLGDVDQKAVAGFFGQKAQANDFACG
jgi:hypothetical protein